MAAIYIYSYHTLSSAIMVQLEGTPDTQISVARNHNPEIIAYSDWGRQTDKTGGGVLREAFAKVDLIACIHFSYYRLGLNSQFDICEYHLGEVDGLNY